MEFPTPIEHSRLTVVKLTGSFTVIHTDEPGLPHGRALAFRFPPYSSRILLTFSSVQLLHSAMEMLRVPRAEYLIQQITDGREFLKSVFEDETNDVLIFHDLRDVGDDKQRWFQITREMVTAEGDMLPAPTPAAPSN